MTPPADPLEKLIYAGNHYIFTKCYSKRAHVVLYMIHDLQMFGA